MVRAISIIIGFIVFEIISKWVKRKMNPVLHKYKGYLPADWVEEGTAPVAAVQPVSTTTQTVEPGGPANERIR